TQPGKKRRKRRLVAFHIELLLGQLHVGGYSREAFNQLFRRPRAGEFRETGDARVETVEERFFVAVHRARERRLSQLIVLRRRTWQREQLRLPLAFVHAPCFGSNLRIGLAEERIVHSQLAARYSRGWRRGGASAKAGPVVQFLGLPRPQSVPDLVGILCGVPGKTESLSGQ